MSDREFDNINGIKVCDQTARNSIPTKTSQLENDSDYATITQVNQAIDNAQLGGGEVDLSGYVTKETGNANQITFTDGQTFQAKLNNGTLKGEKGDKGDQGDRGPQGLQGEQGPKGDKGDPGSTEASGVSIQDTANNFTATNVEGALAELFQSVSSGKSLIASAITDKGVSTSNTATFQEMATNIGSITTQQEEIASEIEVTWQDGYKLDRGNGTATTGQEKYFSCDYIAYENGLYYKLVSGAEIDKSVSIEVFYYDANKNYLGEQDNYLGNSHGVLKETTQLELEPLTNAKFIRFRGYNNKSVFATHADLQSHLTLIKSSVAKYSITYNLTNVTSSNTDTTIEGGKAYTTTLTANSGYRINTPTITVDGLDVTSKYYSDGIFTINNVFGDIVITADATEIIIGEGLTLNYTFNNETPGNGYGTISLLASSDDTAGTYAIQYADDNGALSNYDNICTLTTTNGQQANYTHFIKDQMIPKYATKIIAVKDNQTMAEFVIPEAKRFTSGNYGQHLYSFGAISDIHTGADTWDTDLQEAFTYLNEKESVLFTCAAGDITNDGTQTQFENFKAIKDTYTPNTPFYATNGNHEWYNSSFSDDFWRTYIDNDRTCLFTQGNDVFIMFGNQGTSTTGCFTDEQKTWLETQLVRYANCRVFVFCHYFINGTDNGNFNNYYGVNVVTTSTANGQWILALLQQYPNMFWFSGHSHMKFIVQELCSKITICNEYGGNELGYMIHLPSITNPREVLNGHFTGKLAAESEGVVIDVYENCVLYRGRNFVDKKFIPIGQYILPKAQGILPSEDKYVIAKQLNNSTSSNSATVAVKNSSYTTTITPNDGYVINKITVLMGGADVTSTVVSGNIITIDSVTGDISITVKTIAVTDKDNAIWKVMMLSQTTGEEQPNDTAGLSSQYIAYNSGHTYTLFMKAGLYHTSKVFCYDANQSYITNIAHSAPVNGNYTTVDYYSSLTIPENTAYIRLRTRKQTNGHGDLTTNTVNNYIKLLTEEDMVAITGISLSATELVFNTQNTQTLTVTKTPSNATVNVSFNSSDNRIATVNELGIVTPVARGNCVITATAGDATATCNVTVTNTLKSISTNLCQVTSSNSVTSYVEGASYNTTLTADDGGSINHVRITMGGEDITNTAYNANTGEVNIASVTSDVVINALGVTCM